MKFRFALAGFLTALVTIVVLGAGRQQPVAPQATSKGVKILAGAENYMAGITGISHGGTPGAITSSTIIDVTSVHCGGYEKVSLPATFSTASATIVVTALRCTFDGTNLEIVGAESATLTGSAAFTVDGKYPSTSEADFDTKGCHLIKFVWAAPSAGTVNLGTVKVH